MTPQADLVRDKDLAQRLLSKPEFYPPEFKRAIPNILQLDVNYKVLLKQLPDLEDPVTLILLNGGYATQAWVQAQGYLTSASLAGYATQAWVLSQSYVTSSDLTTALASYLTIASASSTYETQAHAASTYQTIAGSPTVLTSVRSSDITRSGTGLVTTGLSVSIPSSGTYTVQLVGIYQSSGTTDGIDFALHYTGTSSVETFDWMCPGSSSSQRTGWSANADTVTFSTVNGPGTANTDFGVSGQGILRCTTSGTLSLYFASSGATDTAKLRTGSAIIVTKVA